MKWLEGKKTYLVAGAAAVVAGLKGLGIEVPEWIWMMLASFGFAFLRAGVQKVIKE